MRPTEEQDQAEKEKAEQIIAETPLMEGVECVTVEFGDDHDGDPAMWLIFHLRPDLATDDQWLERFSQYNRDIDRKIIHSGLIRFPHSRLRTAA